MLSVSNSLLLRFIHLPSPSDTDVDMLDRELARPNYFRFCFLLLGNLEYGVQYEMESVYGYGHGFSFLFLFSSHLSAFQYTLLFLYLSASLFSLGIWRYRLELLLHLGCLFFFLLFIFLFRMISLLTCLLN
ncbi:hypothetical protein BDV18DRAFT_127631 [Aspergillus unguis]